MQKEFNDTGVCIAKRHYMVDTTPKLKQVIQLVDKGKYFTINRPRQFGKTTTLRLLQRELQKRNDYRPVLISFEGIGSDSYENVQSFIESFLFALRKTFRFYGEEKILDLFKNMREVAKFNLLDEWITTLVQTADKPMVLMIDEVDKSSNNQLFLDFLGLLRNKYLDAADGWDFTFHSVILAGVHDIKTIKTKIRANGERKYNSPWNIAIDFEVDLSFAPHEIETMLQAYSQEKQIQPDIPAIAEKLYYYTSGYPYLVSKLCKFIDEKIIPKREDSNWYLADVEAALKMIADEGYTTTLFDSLAKNLENNRDLYELITQISINGESFPFTITNPVINLGHLYGILVRSEESAERGRCQIHNRVFEQRIYAHMMSELRQAKYRDVNGFGGPEFYTDEGLDVKLILQRFQTFMKEHYSNQDAKFLEREGRLLFLAYLRPIINGRGFDFKEPNIGDERRMDLVITYQNKRYVIELKRWYGPKKHQEGLDQLSDYLDTYSLKEGCLLIYDFRKKKEYKQEQITFKDKSIFAVWV